MRRPRGPAVSYTHLDVYKRQVLQMHFLTRAQVLAHRESRERRLVESGEDELFLAGIVVDVADCKNAGDARLETRRIDADGPLVEGESPLGDGPELRMQLSLIHI